MALDRRSIERRDFPIGHRGYDPEAVDAHLTAVADEVAELRRSAHRRSDTLAASASEQVRAIVEVAEASAADIQRDAEADAREIRDEATNEARATREQATERAREYVGTVSASTDTMLERLDAMRSELDQLIESLRIGSGRLGADLKVLQTSLGEVASVVSPRGFEPEEPAPLDGDEALDGGDDVESARLVALNMALDGTTREETARYLDATFSLTDAGELLDEVYETVEG